MGRKPVIRSKGKNYGYRFGYPIGLTGRICDCGTEEPANDQEVGGVVTDAKGDFKLQDVPTGTYQLWISFLGYATREIGGVELTPKKPDADLGDIQLQPEGLDLAEVTVTDEAALIENRIDKIVFNAEKDITSLGGDASDVLRKVPLLSVDINGNVSLRGSSNIQVLLNGRPSTFFSNDLANALKTLPADQIKKIEVITSPTAKYDGEGTAGIINIITKKKNVQGITGSLSGSIGTRQNNANFSLAIGKGRFGLNAAVGSFLSWAREGNFTFYREDATEEQTRILEQSGPTTTGTYGPGGNVSAFYDINAYNSLSSSLSFRGFGQARDGVTNARFLIPETGFEQTYARENEFSFLRGGFDWTNDYRRTFKKPDQELSFAVQLSGAKSDSQTDIMQSGNDDSLFRNEQNENDGLNLETTLQLDYTHPFSEAFKLEIGAKTIIRNIDSDYLYELFDPDVNNYVVDQARTDAFFYDQDVYSGYASLNFKLGEKYGLITGLRYEHTAINGDLESGNSAFANDYDNFLPSIILSRKLGKASNLKVSYSRRIQRPSLDFINPYVELTDDRNIRFGNPTLRPELTSLYEINYSTFVKGIVINGSVFFRRTNDVIETFLQVNEAGVTENSYLNIGRNNSIGGNLFTSAGLFKRFITLRGNFTVFSYDGTGNVAGTELSRTNLVANAFLSATLDFKKSGYKAEIFGFYNSPTQSIQGFQASFSLLSLGFKKEFADKKASLGIAIVEPFQENKSFPSEAEGPGFFQRTNFTIPFRSFGLSFSYRFGKLDFKQNQRKSKIKNDDVKAAGESRM